MTFALQQTFGKVWRHFWLFLLEDEGMLLAKIVGKGLDTAKHPTTQAIHKIPHHNKELSGPKTQQRQA